MTDPSKAENGAFVIPPKRHNHAGGEACPGCVYNMMMERDDGFTGGHAVATEAGAETLATARRVSDMYFLRTKHLAAVLLDARGLVRGMDAVLDDRIDTALKAAGFLSNPPAGCVGCIRDGEDHTCGYTPRIGDSADGWSPTTSPASTAECACVGYTIRTDYGTGVEHDVDRSSCPIHDHGGVDDE